MFLESVWQYLCLLKMSVSFNPEILFPRIWPADSHSDVQRCKYRSKLLKWQNIGHNVSSQWDTTPINYNIPKSETNTASYLARRTESSI